MLYLSVIFRYEALVEIYTQPVRFTYWSIRVNLYCSYSSGIHQRILGVMKEKKVAKEMKSHLLRLCMDKYDDG